VGEVPFELELIGLSPDFRPSKSIKWSGSLLGTLSRITFSLE
jgi:hypothetical protein